MRRRLPGLALLTVALLGASASTESPEIVVRRLDAELARAVLRGDVSVMERLFGDDFVVTHPFGGVLERAAVLDLVRKGQIRYTSYEKRVEQIRLGNGVAITIGSETVVPDVVGRPDRGLTVLRRYTNVWRKGAAGWRLSVRHASLVPPTPTPAPSR